MNYEFLGTCVELKTKPLYDMIDNAKEIDYEDIREHISQKELRLIFPGYDWSNQGGLQLHNDYAVSFHKSRYQDMLCLYIRWNAIEHIWIRG